MCVCVCVHGVCVCVHGVCVCVHCCVCVCSRCVCVFTVCVCTLDGLMQSTNSEYGSPYLAVCHVTSLLIVRFNIPVDQK